MLNLPGGDAQSHAEYSKLKWKKEYMQTQFPDEFGGDQWEMDVDLLFVEALSCPEQISTPERYFHG